MPKHRQFRRHVSQIIEWLEGARAVLPELPANARARIEAVRERCDALVGKAERRYTTLVNDANEIETDIVGSRSLRKRAREIRQKAHDRAAMKLLDAQAREYLPLTGNQFPYQTLEVLASTSVTMYGAADAVELRTNEWRARWWKRAGEAPAAPGHARRDEDRKDKEAIAVERGTLLNAYKSEAKERGIRVTDRMIAKAASPTWNDRTPVQRWKRNDRRCTHADDVRIRGVLTKKPHL